MLRAGNATDVGPGSAFTDRTTGAREFRLSPTRGPSPELPEDIRGSKMLRHDLLPQAPHAGGTRVRLGLLLERRP